MDFVSLLGGIVLGAAGAAILDTSSSGGLLGCPPPAPMPEPERPGTWTVPVRARPSVRAQGLRGGIPVVNRIGGMMR